MRGAVAWVRRRDGDGYRPVFAVLLLLSTFLMVGWVAGTFGPSDVLVAEVARRYIGAAATMFTLLVLASRLPVLLGLGDLFGLARLLEPLVAGPLRGPAGGSEQRGGRCSPDGHGPQGDPQDLPGGHHRRCDEAKRGEEPQGPSDDLSQEHPTAQRTGRNLATEGAAAKGPDTRAANNADGLR